jgi:hypothetical protein
MGLVFTAAMGAEPIPGAGWMCQLGRVIGSDARSPSVLVKQARRLRVVQWFLIGEQPQADVDVNQPSGTTGRKFVG